MHYVFALPRYNYNCNAVEAKAQVGLAFWALQKALFVKSQFWLTPSVPRTGNAPPVLPAEA
jgi:hypothetical protein